jgi:site-specific DNA-methyltransferase (adenine-specific)
MPYTATLKKIDQIEESEKVQRLVDQGQIELTTDLQYGDCLKLITHLKPASIDLLVTDPPYGLEKLEALRTAGSSKLTGHQLMSDTHNMTLSEVIQILEMLAPELNRVLKPGAHFYMFCGIQHIGAFINALEPHLEFCPPVVFWDRGKPSAPGYGYNYLSRLEAIIYGCRPPKGRRLNESMYNVIECPDVPKPLRLYPTEKPTPLLQTLIKQSSSPNGMVLDPFAGSASTLVAAREVGRRGLGFEINEESFLRAQRRLQETNGE